MRKLHYLLVLFLLLLTGTVSAKTEAEFTKFIVPYNYFTVPVPVGWEFISTD